jgi:hypothetical protein
MRKRAGGTLDSFALHCASVYTRRRRLQDRTAPGVMAYCASVDRELAQIVFSSLCALRQWPILFFLILQLPR